MEISFCEHGNIIGLHCNDCSPQEPDLTLDTDTSCLVHNLISSSWRFSEFDDSEVTDEEIGKYVSCKNEGLKVRSHSSRQNSLECSSCGWTWIAWKKSGRVTKNQPKLVKCKFCNKITVEPTSRNSSSSCSYCGRKWMRENKPTYFRD